MNPLSPDRHALSSKRCLDRNIVGIARYWTAGAKEGEPGGFGLRFASCKYQDEPYASGGSIPAKLAQGRPRSVSSLARRCPRARRESRDAVNLSDHVTGSTSP